MSFVYETIVVGSVQRQVSTCSGSQLSTDAVVAVSGSELDARLANYITYRISAATNGITVSVWASWTSDFSDEISISTVIGGVSVGTDESWHGQISGTVPAVASYPFYRLKVVATTPGSQGTLSFVGMAK